MNKMNVKERIDTVLDNLKINQSELARLVYVTPASIYNWKKKDQIGKSSAQKIKKLTGFDLNWILTGEGSPYPSNVEMVNRPIEILNENIHETVYEEIPVYNVKLSAGKGIAEWMIVETARPLHFDKEWFKSRNILPQCCRAMIVKGDSMSPDINDGDMVMIDIADTDINDGEIYAVSYDNRSFIKRVFLREYGVELVSSNPAYEETIKIKSDKADLFKILGRKVWRGG